MNVKNEDLNQYGILFSEKQENAITYTKSLYYKLTTNTPSDYTFGQISKKKDSLIVPYSVIKEAKTYKSDQVLEILLLASERPDRLSNIRSTLDTWGLSSYVDYIYTVAELAFLEGLTPIFEGGFFSPSELKKMSEILSFFKILIPSTNLTYYEKKYSALSAKKHLDIRLKMLEWTGKLNIPIVSGILIGADETNEKMKSTISTILNYHATYNHIHSLSIQSDLLFTTGSTSDDSDKKMLNAISFIKQNSPDLMISVNPIHMSNVEKFIDAGVRDFGSIPVNPEILFPNIIAPNIEKLEKIVASKKLQLQPRLPIKYDFIKEGKYSKKLGQVYDNLSYKIKKFEQEKTKDGKKT